MNEEALLNLLSALSGLCFCVLTAAIALNFIHARQTGVAHAKKSHVATGRMFLFFFAMAALVKLQWGNLSLGGFGLPVSIIGCAMIVFGTVVNVLGRMVLKNQWGNQIKIYEDHCLITRGVYAWVRHPLYASTILMLIGFALQMHNALVLVGVIAIFIPMMVYRAKQEEALLCQSFSEYPQYAAKVGMLFPKVRRNNP